MAKQVNKPEEVKDQVTQQTLIADNEEMPDFMQGDGDGIIAKKSAPREKIPAGLHQARCYSMIDLGHISKEFQGKKLDQPVHTIRLSWEFPDLLISKEGKEDKPMVIDKEYTLSMSPKANLRKDMESWRGVPYTDQELNGVDVTNMVGATCMLNIIHKAGTGKNSDKVYENISAITPVPTTLDEKTGKRKKTAVADPINKQIIFNWRGKFDYKFLMKLPEWIQKPMLESQEYKWLLSKGKLDQYINVQKSSEQLAAEVLNGTAGSHVPVTGIDKEDLPF